MYEKILESTNNSQINSGSVNSVIFIASKTSYIRLLGKFICDDILFWSIEEKFDWMRKLPN